MMLLMTDRTVGHALGHREGIVIVLALMMAALTVLVVNRSHGVIDARQSHQRLPRCLVTTFAVSLCGFVTRCDRARQIDRVIVSEREHRDKEQRQDAAHERHPTSATVHAVGDSIDMQIESLGYRRIGS